jgi:hypothetical protein
MSREHRVLHDPSIPSQRPHPLGYRFAFGVVEPSVTTTGEHQNAAIDAVRIGDEGGTPNIPTPLEAVASARLESLYRRNNDTN